MKTQSTLRSLAALAVLLLPLSGVAQVWRKPIQYFRPYDQRGINVFETPKQDTVKYEGFAVRVGAAFTQSYQALSHENDPILAPGTLTSGSQPATRNQLLPIYGGFNLANANLYIDAQLADGIRVHLANYMSSRHHNEFWVKGGYIQFDKLPFKGAFFDRIMQNLTIKMGHYDVNYGDAHFRRSDGAQTLYNPFIENNLLDAFATEIGVEFIYQNSGFLAVAQVTEGTIRGGITGTASAPLPSNRQPSFIGKLGYDKQVNDDLRLRLTASVYTNASSTTNTIYAGDRTGSNYFNVVEPALGFSATGNFTSGRVNPGFSDFVTAVMINPFIKWRGLEFFGTYETANGAGFASSTNLETGARDWSQFAGDLVYRFADERLFVGVRYNRAQGALPATRINLAAPNTPPNIADNTQAADVSVDRFAAGAGWFLTPSVLLKGEYVTQNYNDFSVNSVFRNAKFSGLVVQAIIAF